MTLDDRIAQFRQMTIDDPENELAYFRLGQLLMEADQHGEAIGAFRKTLMIAPQFSKVFQLLAECELKQDRRDDAVRTLLEGYRTADARGDRVPRDAMGEMLKSLGEAIPESPKKERKGTGGGFSCKRPMCYYGDDAVGLTTPPLPDEIGQRIVAEICMDCWNEWLKDMSIKVINELRLDLSLEAHQQEYDKQLRRFLGFEETPAGD
ncbi:MAG: Fe(2+)-trafficking protein [Gemmataceae bacterium]|nr:Fe(2+)-trafficking protein [Gemmataceae bacterium]